MSYQAAYHPPPAPPAPPASPELRRAGRRSLALALVSPPLTITALGAPAALVASVACAVTAVVLGIRAAHAVSRTGAATVGTAVAGLTVGALSLLLAAAMAIGLFLYWSQLSGLRECLSGANTTIAQQACEQGFVDNLTHPTSLAG